MSGVILLADRLFIDIFIRGNEHGKYDFDSDNDDAQQRQAAKIGAKATEYQAMYVNAFQISNQAAKLYAPLQYALKYWNSKQGRTKLKIRINAHGAPNSDGFIMGDRRISTARLAAWLTQHGLRHRASDTWSLVISLVVCYGAEASAQNLVTALNGRGVKGFTVTASPHVTMLPDGRPGWVEDAPYYLLWFIRFGTHEVPHDHWTVADGSKQIFAG
jgi:hypothetical protein